MIGLRAPSVRDSRNRSRIFCIFVIEHSHLTFDACFCVNCAQEVLVDAFGLRVLQLIMDVFLQLLKRAIP